MQRAIESPAAFLAGGGGAAGGLVDACDDDCCSICLEPFCSNNPATVTSCEHAYHVQCILEWTKKSRECPMCWQPLCLKDPCSQELLDVVEQEKKPWMCYASSEDSLDSTLSENFDDDFEEPIWDNVFHRLMLERMALPRRPLNTQDNGDHSRGQRRLSRRRFGHSRHGGESSNQWEDLAPSNLSGSASGHFHGLGRQHDSSERHRSHQQSSSVIQPLKSRFLVASAKCKEALTSTTRSLREKWHQQMNKMEQSGARAQEEMRRAMKRISPEDVATTSSGWTA